MRIILPLFISLIILCTLTAGVAAFAQQASTNDRNPSYNKLLEGYTYPFDVHEFEFRSQGQDLKMAYMYLPAKKPEMGVVTLFHGKNFNGAYWEQTANFLQSLGYGVLIPDQIGFGKSSKPLYYQYSFAALANNTKLLQESLNLEKSTIVGHSMGGMLAARYSILYPEATERLILVNPIGLENYLHFVEYKDIDFFYQNELKQKPENIVKYQKDNYYDGDWNDAYAALSKPLIGWINGPNWSHMAMVSAKTYDMIFNGPVIDEFDEFEVPVTLIIGTRDRTGPGRNWKRDGVNRELGRYDLLGKEVSARNPDIHIIELNDLGHLPHIENFERFKAVFSQALISEIK